MLFIFNKIKKIHELIDYIEDMSILIKILK
jgi:hypothetical protein